jgi:hypothetical protein
MTATVNTPGGRDGAETAQAGTAPPGQRNGRGTDSLRPYLMQALAAKPKPGPPGGIERRRWPRD